MVTEVRQPTTATLRKYGLSAADWRAILDRQAGACGVCGKVPASGTLHIDHAHVRGWKNMAPADRRLFVRGLTCFTDNSVFLRRGATPERLRAAADYLERFERRSASNGMEAT